MKFSKKTLIIIVAVAAVQGGLFFAAIKFFGGAPQPSYGATGEPGRPDEHYTQGGDPTRSMETVEVDLLKKFRVPNTKSGRTWVYDFDIKIVVPADRKAAVESLVTERAGEISDRVAQIVRAADSRTLQEDDFRTLRMQIEQALATIFRDEKLVQRVLIPRCVPTQAD